MTERELPGNAEQEQALLGALMVNNEALDGIPDLEPKHFEAPFHGEIFEAIQNLILQGAAANPLTVKSRIPERQVAEGMTTAQYLAKLATHVVNIVNVPDFARGIIEDYNRRRLIGIGDEMVNVAYSVRNPVKLIEEVDGLRDSLDDISVGLAGKEEQTGEAVADSYLSLIDRNEVQHSGDGVPLCLPELGTVMSDTHLRPGRVYGLLSSSGEGKTSLTMQQIYHSFMADCPVLFLSYDQSWLECIAQMGAQNLGVEMRRQMQRDLSQEEFEKCRNFANAISKRPFEVINCTNENVPKLSAYARRWHKKIRVKYPATPLIVVDHIKAVTPADPRADAGTKAQQVGQDFKALARSLDAAVFVIQQRSSSGMKRTQPRPIRSDLYGGEIARTPFDGIFYLFRGEMYRQMQMDVAGTPAEKTAIEDRFPLNIWEGKAEIGCLKVRFGDDSIRRKLRWVSRYTSYESAHGAEEELPLHT